MIKVILLQSKKKNGVENMADVSYEYASVRGYDGDIEGEVYYINGASYGPDEVVDMLKDYIDLYGELSWMD